MKYACVVAAVLCLSSCAHYEEYLHKCAKKLEMCEKEMQANKRHHDAGIITVMGYITCVTLTRIDMVTYNRPYLKDECGPDDVDPEGIDDDTD